MALALMHRWLLWGLAAALWSLPVMAGAERARGIDVSTFQGQVNWTSVRSSGRVFAWARATEGETYTDPTFTNNALNAQAAGVLLGAYHFARPDLHFGPAGAASEADHFWEVAGNFILTGNHTCLMPVLDIEHAPGAGYTKTTLSQWVNAWCSNVVMRAASEGISVKPLVYTYISYANNWLDTTVTNWPLWMANNYAGQDVENGGPSSLGPWSTWAFWQYGQDPVPGVSGDCDVNVFKGPAEQLGPYVIGGLANQVSLSVSATPAAEPTTPSQFTISRHGFLTNAFAVFYSVGGSAAGGDDYHLLAGTAVFQPGQTNFMVTVTPLDDPKSEPTETVTLTLNPSAGYALITPTTATMNLLDDGDLPAGTVAAWLCNENDNTARSLDTVAFPVVPQTNSVQAGPVQAGPGLGNFGRNNDPGVGHGYATSQWYSYPTTLYLRGEFWGTNAFQAFADGDYLSFTLGPQPDHTLTLTNFSVRLKMQPSAGQTASVFLRSSVNNYSTSLGFLSVPGTAETADPWLLWNVPLTFKPLATNVEFRLFAYGTRSSSSDILRLDEFVCSGHADSITPPPIHMSDIAIAGGNILISFTANSSDPASAFRLQSATVVIDSFADDASAIVTAVGPGQFVATTAMTEAIQFYRIRRE